MFGDAVEVDSHAGAYQPPLTTTTQRPQPPPALHSQAQVPHEAAKHAAAAAPDLVSRFTAREPLYRQMVLGSRDVGGLIRGGAQPSSTASTPQRAYNKASPTRRIPTSTCDSSSVPDAHRRPDRHHRRTRPQREALPHRGRDGAFPVVLQVAEPARRYQQRRTGAVDCIGYLNTVGGRTEPHLLRRQTAHRRMLRPPLNRLSIGREPLAQRGGSNEVPFPSLP